MLNRPREEMIIEIRGVYQELRELGVSPQRINLNDASLEKLESELEAVGDQLETRKRFLGVQI